MSHDAQTDLSQCHVLHFGLVGGTILVTPSAAFSPDPFALGEESIWLALRDILNDNTS